MFDGQGQRGFWDLLSHADKLAENDECGRQIHSSLQALLPGQVMGVWEQFTEVYGRIIINSFEVKFFKIWFQTGASAVVMRALLEIATANSYM